MDIGTLPNEELRTNTNRFSHSDTGSTPAWRKRNPDPTKEPAMIGDYSWDTNTQTPTVMVGAGRQDSLDGSVATPGPHSQRSGSTGVFSPPQSEASGDRDQSMNGDLNAFTSNEGGSFGYDDNQPAGFVSFKDYPPANMQSPGSGQNFSLTGQSPMTQQQFDELTKQFLPPTPGGGLDLWSSGISTGLMPGANGEDWTQMLSGIDENNTWPPDPNVYN